MRQKLTEGFIHTALLDSYLSQDPPTSHDRVNNGWPGHACERLPQSHTPKRHYDGDSEAPCPLNASFSHDGIGGRVSDMQVPLVSAVGAAEATIECTEQPRQVLARLPFVSRHQRFRSDSLSFATKHRAAKEPQITIAHGDGKDFMSALRQLRDKYGHSARPARVAEEGPLAGGRMFPGSSKLTRASSKGYKQHDAMFRVSQSPSAKLRRPACLQSQPGLSEHGSSPCSLWRSSVSMALEDGNRHTSSARSPVLLNDAHMRMTCAYQSHWRENGLTPSDWLAPMQSCPTVTVTPDALATPALTPIAKRQSRAVTSFQHRQCETYAYDAPLTPRTPLTDSLRDFFARQAAAVHESSDMQLASAWSRRTPSQGLDNTIEARWNNVAAARCDTSANVSIWDNPDQPMQFEGDLQVQLRGADDGSMVDAAAETEALASPLQNATSGIEFIRMQYPDLFGRQMERDGKPACVWQDDQLRACPLSSVASCSQSPVVNTSVPQNHHAKLVHSGSQTALQVEASTKGQTAFAGADLTASLERNAPSLVSYNGPMANSPDRSAFDAPGVAEVHVSGLSDRASKLLAHALTARQLWNEA
eukprot:jgi/Ulvmu1/3173/UM015_0214.1